MNNSQYVNPINVTNIYLNNNTIIINLGNNNPDIDTNYSNDGSMATVDRSSRLYACPRCKAVQVDVL